MGQLYAEQLEYKQTEHGGWGLSECRRLMLTGKTPVWDGELGGGLFFAEFNYLSYMLINFWKKLSSNRKRSTL